MNARGSQDCIITECLSVFPAQERRVAKLARRLARRIARRTAVATVSTTAVAASALTSTADCTPSVAVASLSDVPGGAGEPESPGPSDAAQVALDGALASALAQEDKTLAVAQGSLDGCADDDAPEDEGVTTLLSSVVDGSEDELLEGGPEEIEEAGEGTGDVYVGCSEDCLSGDDTLEVVSRAIDDWLGVVLAGSTPPQQLCF